MRPLKEVLDSLNRELGSAWAGAGADPTRVLDRVVVRLDGVLRDVAEGPAWWIRTEGDPAPPAGVASSRIELELQFARVAAVPTVPAPTGVPATWAAAPAPEPKAVDAGDTVGRYDLLAGVLGAPGGFAAFCRADTLATAMESLRDEDWSGFVQALERSLVPELDPVVQAAWGTVRNALRSGPAGSVEAGLARIREPLRLWSRAQWIRILREGWKNEPAPIPDPPGIRVDSPSSRN